MTAIRLKEGTDYDPTQIDLAADFIFDGDAPLEPPRALVKGLIPFKGICFMGGQSGAGKTFLACELAAALASGTSFFGRKVSERVGVVILAAEGAATIPTRARVANDRRAPEERLPVSWLTSVPNLADKRGVPALVTKLRALDARMRREYGVRLGAVICDTLAAAFDLKDENDNSEAASVTRIMRQISEETEAVFIPVHHYGKGMETGLRGASAWRANCDAVISVLCDRNQITGKSSNRRIALTKSRTSEEGPIGAFELRFVKLGIDEDGEDFGACVIETSEAVEIKNAKARLSRAARSYMDALQIALLASGRDAHPFGSEGPMVKAVDRETIRTEFYGAWPADGDTEAKRQESKRKSFNRGERDLLDGRAISSREIAGTVLIWAV